MTFGKPAGPELQPATFAFTEENLSRANEIIAYYPPGNQQSAVMPLLWLAQKQHDNWLPRAAMDYVADMLSIPRIRAYEVASFYSMYNPAPVGKFHLQVCTTTPCWLCNSDSVVKAVTDTAGVGPGHSSDDGMFTVTEVECLGACVNGPVVQVNDDYYEDLDYDSTVALINDLKAGKNVLKGSQKRRIGSMAATGPTSLKDLQPKAPAEPASNGSEGSPLEAAGGIPPEIRVAHDRAMHLASKAQGRNEEAS
ncbi:NADH-quinone oxidoreductase subunit NuoE [Fodinicurvata sp. EGI_FJ10296]|uniref:NADH-quinone oxidoreductase subunit NuoE n=1 Tax=Fodinicurvata sp. EGI_FJ10296 TaxID=3231908 RepID=UPI0034512E0F